MDEVVRTIYLSGRNVFILVDLEIVLSSPLTQAVPTRRAAKVDPLVALRSNATIHIDPFRCWTC